MQLNARSHANHRYDPVIAHIHTHSRHATNCALDRPLPSSLRFFKGIWHRYITFFDSGGSKACQYSAMGASSGFRLTVMFLYRLLREISGEYWRLFKPSRCCRSFEYLSNLYLRGGRDEPGVSVSLR